MTVWIIWFPHSMLGPAYSIWGFFHSMAGSLLLNVKYLRHFHTWSFEHTKGDYIFVLVGGFHLFVCKLPGYGLHVERTLHDHFTSSQRDWSSCSYSEPLIPLFVFMFCMLNPVPEWSPLRFSCFGFRQDLTWTLNIMNKIKLMLTSENSALSTPCHFATQVRAFF